MKQRLTSARGAVKLIALLIVGLVVFGFVVRTQFSAEITERLVGLDTWRNTSGILRGFVYPLLRGAFETSLQVITAIILGLWLLIRGKAEKHLIRFQLPLMILATLGAMAYFVNRMPLDMWFYKMGGLYTHLWWFGLALQLLVITAWVGFALGFSSGSGRGGGKSTPKGFLLYILTFIIEAFITSIRWVLIYIALLLPVFLVVVYWQVENDIRGSIKMFQDTATISRNIALVFVPLNLVMSLLVLVGLNIPLDRVKLSFDSREPVNEERAYIINFYRRLDDNEQVFVSWNVIESAGVFAFTYGRAIFISRGAFTDSVFNALVAHELGHLKRGNGVMLQALHSFTYPFFNHLLFNPSSIQRGMIDLSEQRQNANFLLSGFVANLTTTLFTIIFGGFGVQMLARWWSRYFILDDYEADEYAVSLGFGYELMSYLENTRDFDTNLPLFNRWRGYTRVRLEKIQELIQSKLSEQTA